MNNPFIPLVDLKAQFETLRPDIESAINDVLQRADFILGEALGQFEKEFSAFCGTRHAIGCANGTDALHLALRALDIGPDDEVIVPAMTFVATALGVTQAGARPVLVDVDPQTALMNPDLLEDAITERTRAIVPVHLYGQCADMERIQEIAQRHGIFVVEDAAQAHGALDKRGLRAGGMGDIGCFSFYPGKNLGAYGDGGALVTNDDEVANRLRELRNWGSERKYVHEVTGFNSRLDTLQAAILGTKLPHLEDWNARRRQHAAGYGKALEGIEGIDLTPYGEDSVYHLYVIRVDERDGVLQTLNEAGIGAGIHYPFAVHELGAYRHLGYQGGAFPVAEAWARRCLSLPLYAELPEGVLDRVAGLLRQAVGRNV